MKIPLLIGISLMSYFISDDYLRDEIDKGLLGLEIVILTILIIISIKENYKYFKNSRERKILENCGNVCYCKNCHEPLNDNSECNMLSEDGLYEYTCAKCSTKSKFHFGIAPVPIMID